MAPVAVLEAILRPSSARHASASIQRLLAFSVLTSVTAELRLRGPKIKIISEFLILFVHPPNLHSLQRLLVVTLKNFHRKKIVSTNLLRTRFYCLKIRPSEIPREDLSVQERT